MQERVRGIIGERKASTAIEVSTWITSLFLLTIVTRTNQVLAGDSFFFVAHSTSARSLIVLWIVAIGSALIVLTGFLTVVKSLAVEKVFDLVATALTFAASVFLLVNAFGPTVGIPAGVAFTVLARRVAFGRALLLISAVTAVIPLLAVSPATGNAFAARTVDIGSDGDRPDILWVLPDRLQYQVLFDSDGRVRPQFPNLAELQRVSTTYERAYATANGTELSVPSMLNGVASIPLDSDKMQELQRSPGIVSWLAPAYEVSVDSTLFSDICTSTACSQAQSRQSGGFQELGVFVADVTAVAGNTLAPALASRFPPLEGRWRDFWDREPAPTGSGADGQEPLAWQAVLDGGERPKFALWHFLGTHDPYNRDFDGLPIFGNWLPADVGTWYNHNGSSPSDISERLSRRLYLAAAVDFDRRLGILLDRLKANGRFDQTMLVLNSDHGRAFTRSGDSRIGDDQEMIWNEVAHVPLMVKLPGQTQSQRVIEPRSTAQIAKTILDEAGVVVGEGPPIAPELSLHPEEGPFFTLDLGLETPRTEALPLSLPSTETWARADLESVDDALPLSITDDDLVAGEPLTGVWKEFEPSRLTAVEGDSALQLLGVEDAQLRCPVPRHRAVVTLQGELAAQIVFDRTAHAPSGMNRGWTVVPKAPADSYRFWCQRV